MKRALPGGDAVSMEIFHVVPLGDLRDHDSDPECWCRPIQDDECLEVWVHNSMDRREHTKEQGILQ